MKNYHYLILAIILIFCIFLLFNVKDDKDTSIKNTYIDSLTVDLISTIDSINIVDSTSNISINTLTLNKDSLRKDSIRRDKLQKENFKKITRIINGGYNGLKDRESIWERAKETLKETN